MRRQGVLCALVGLSIIAAVTMTCCASAEPFAAAESAPQSRSVESAPTAVTESVPSTESAPETEAAPPAEPSAAPYVEDPALAPPQSLVAEDVRGDEGGALLLMWEPSPDDPAPRMPREREQRTSPQLRWLSKRDRNRELANIAAAAAKLKCGYVILRKTSEEAEFLWSPPMVPTGDGEGTVREDPDFVKPEEVPGGTREFTDDRFAFLVPPGEDSELVSDKPPSLDELQRLRARRARNDPRLNTYDYEVRFVKDDRMSPPAVIRGVRPVGNLFNPWWINVGIVVIVAGGLILGFIFTARAGRALYIRPIAGLQAVDDAVGRATEMGRPIVFSAGFDGVASISTIAAMVILGRIARVAAEHGTQIMVPCLDPVVMAALREVVRESYMSVGRPEDYREDRIYYLTGAQFAYAAGVSGLIVRERVAACFYMGYFYAESLILAETGALAGAVQIVGTDAYTQLPFFVTACDYTLMGEEYYGASAYLSREPKMLGSLKGQDYSKLIIGLAMIISVVLATVFERIGARGVAEFIQQLFHFSTG